MNKKKKKINRTTITAHVVAGIMSGILLTHADMSKGVSARLHSELLTHTTRFKKSASDKVLMQTASIAYETIKTLDEEILKETSHAVILETIAFDFEPELKEYFGNNFLSLVDRYAMKASVNAGASYEVAEQIKKTVRKKVFDGLKGELI